MKKLFLFFVLFSVCKIATGQDASTTHAEFNFQGKTYVADYDNAKHILKMNEEVSFEIYDETGSCIKRSEGLTVDFKSILKTEEKTFTVRFFKKSKKKKASSKKNASIKQKGEIGVMVITDQK